MKKPRKLPRMMAMTVGRTSSGLSLEELTAVALPVMFRFSMPTRISLRPNRPMEIVTTSMPLTSSFRP